jgi:ABC-type antimicrobial peptide transport system permease subunit
VRTKGDPQPLVQAMERIVRALDPEVPLSSVVTTEELVNARLAQPRLVALVAGLFAVAAVVLSLLGLYSVLAYNVRQRAHELGMRLVLGADRRDLLILVLRDSLRIVVVGAAVGGAAALMLVRAARAFVYAIDPASPLLFLALVTLLIVVSLAASLAPALRASRANPVKVLRAD